ncbi:MAG: hypothetical protein IPK63_17070 [Candidatus Competibacteraceae bacterium]|nr:hypothetical protein [Candidatus Competibacteraceae bacterium]
MKCVKCDKTEIEVSQCPICKRDYCSDHITEHENCVSPGKEEENSGKEESLAKRLKKNSGALKEFTGSKEEPSKIEGSVSLNHENTFDVIEEPMLEIHHIDVGQGESTLIRCIPIKEDKIIKEPINILIDGGTRTRGGGTVIRYLGQLNIKTLHLVICSHYDNDHYQGLQTVSEQEKIKIEQYVHPVEKQNAFGTWTASNGPNQFINFLVKKGIKPVYATSSTHFTFQVQSMKKPIEFKLQCLGGMKPDMGGFKNNDASLPWLVNFGEFSYFTAGDLEAGDELFLANKIIKKHVCAFKCGHHGSRESTSEDFVDAIEPAAAFISCGKHAHFHPRQEVVDVLSKSNKIQQFYLTNCFHDRKHVNPDNANNNGMLKGRVAGDAGHLGTIVLRTTASQANRHEFCVGYFDDGSWMKSDEGSENKWRWILHECHKKMLPVPVDGFYYKDLSSTVNLGALAKFYAEKLIESAEWKKDILSHHNYLNLESIVAYGRFKEPEEASSTKKSPITKYNNASEWLWDVLCQDSDYILDSFIESGEETYENRGRKKFTQAEFIALMNNQLDSSLKKFFENEYKQAVHMVKKHPKGSIEYELDGSELIANDPKMAWVVNKFMEENVKNSYLESLIKEKRTRASSALKTRVDSTKL